jgi:hypothetical protein
MPELTAERFVTLALPEFGRSVRVYRSGDLGFWNQEGDLVFVGRRDDQLKVQGIRVELQEIETCLNAHPLVKCGVVAAKRRPSSEPVLVAFLELSNESPVALKQVLARIDRDLRQELPAYMVPQGYRVLEVLPRNSSGKVDRGGLLAKDMQADQAQRAEARDGTEERLLGIWREQNSDAHLASCTVSLLEQGVSSLRLSLFLAEVIDAFDAEAHLAELATATTIRELASILNVLPNGEDACIA